MSNVQTATTPVGEVEYETVTCDSCGNDVLKKDAYGFIIYSQDKLKQDKSWHNHHEWEVYDGHYKTGYACEFCYNEGPADYPRLTGTMRRFNALYESIFIDDLDMWRMGTFGFVLASLILWTIFILAGLAALAS